MNNMYDLSIAQTATLIRNIGAKRTVIAQGHIGTGKTTGIAAELKRQLPGHTYVEFDCTNKDVQDLSVPRFMDKVADMISDYVEFVPNAELGAHLGKPIILNFDEFFKAVEPVKRGVRRIMLERMVNGIELPEGSIVYGTSNLGAEGVGDALAAHQRNAVIVVNVRKPDPIEWIEWGINNGIDPIVLGWVKDNPHAMQTFEEIKNPDDNMYIFHPRAQRDAFVTPRSLEAASDLLKIRHLQDDMTTTGALIGTIGAPAAMDMMAFVHLASELPTIQSIKDNPMGAKVPSSSVAANCMIVFKALATLEEDWIDQWMTYLERLPEEASSMFINGVRAKGYRLQGPVLQNAKVTKWAQKHPHLFSADQ